MKFPHTHLLAVAASLVLSVQVNATEIANPASFRSVNESATTLSLREKTPEDQAKALAKYTEKLTDWGHDVLIRQFMQIYDEAQFAMQISEVLMARTTPAAVAKSQNYAVLYSDASARFASISNFVNQSVLEYETLIADPKTSNGQIKKFYKTRRETATRWQAELDRAVVPIKSASSFEIAAGTTDLQRRMTTLQNAIPTSVNIVTYDDAGNPIGRRTLTPQQAMEGTLQGTLETLRGIQTLERHAEQMQRAQTDLKSAVFAVGLPSYVFINMYNFKPETKDNLRFTTVQKLSKGSRAKVSEFAQRLEETFGRLSEQYDVKLKWTVEPTVDSVGSARENEIVAGQRMALAQALLKDVFLKSRQQIVMNSSIEPAVSNQTAVRSLPDRGVEVRVVWVLSAKTQMASKK